MSRAHHLDDLLARQLAFELRVDVELVDHLGEPAARQDLHRDQVQPAVQLGLREVRLDELLGDRLRLDQQRGARLVLVRQDRGNEDRQQHRRGEQRQHELAAALQDALHVVELDALFGVHGDVLGFRT